MKIKVKYYVSIPERKPFLVLPSINTPFSIIYTGRDGERYTKRLTGNIINNKMKNREVRFYNYSSSDTIEDIVKVDMTLIQELEMEIPEIMQYAI